MDLFLPVKKKIKIKDKCVKGPNKSLVSLCFHYKENILEFLGSSSQV